MDKKLKFTFIQRSASCWNIGNLEFYVFQRGKILPVALIELTPYTVRVSNFRLEETELEKVKKEFHQFSGCEI